MPPEKAKLSRARGLRPIGIKTGEPAFVRAQRRLPCLYARTAHCQHEHYITAHERMRNIFITIFVTIQACQKDQVPSGCEPF